MELNWRIGLNGQQASRYNGKQRTDYTVTQSGEIFIASWAMREATAELTSTPFEHGLLGEDYPSEAAAMAACKLRANR